MDVYRSPLCPSVRKPFLTPFWIAGIHLAAASLVIRQEAIFDYLFPLPSGLYAEVNVNWALLLPEQ